MRVALLHHFLFLEERKKIELVQVSYSDYYYRILLKGNFITNLKQKQTYYNNTCIIILYFSI